jgi:hypothetical protein
VYVVFGHAVWITCWKEDVQQLLRIALRVLWMLS